MTGTRSSDLRVRTIVGAILVAVAIAALWLGGLALWLLATAMALAALVEWAGLVRHDGLRPDRLRAGVALLILSVAMTCAMPALWGTDRSSVALLLIASLLFAMVPGCVTLACGTSYVGLAAIGLLFLRAQPEGVLFALWALAIVWATDIGAYFAGRRIGGAKLAPKISPNKTWAGLIGGMVAAGIVGAGLAAAGLPGPCLWLGPLLVVIAQAGDLMESGMKRAAGVKDSGALLPGHGGVLDRIDGALPVLIVVAALRANGTI